MGWFFQDRYKATRLTDEASLLACAAYVDLNPIRAAMAETVEQSDHTSAQRRIETITGETESPSGSAQQPDVEPASRPDSFLSPLCIDEQNDPIGACPNAAGTRCSDKGFLGMSLEDYLKLLDWTARQVTPGKRGVTPEGVPPILQRLGLDRASWCELVSDFGKLFCCVAKKPECVDAMRSHRTHRRYHLKCRGRELLSSLE